MERKKNVEAIKRLIQEKKGHIHPSQPLFRFLLSKGISKTIAEEITAEFIQHQEEIVSLQQIVAKRIRTCKNKDLFSKKVAFVGPLGVGKTTLILKLAHACAKKKKKIAILTLEPEKIKAQILKCRLHPLVDIPVFDKGQNFTDFETVWIDTPGCSFYDEKRIDQLGDMLAFSNEIETVLTLSMLMKEEDLYASIHQFSCLRPSGLALTQIDATLTAGCLLNIFAKIDLPLYFASDSPLVDEEIQVADPYKITHTLLTGLNQDKYQYLRQMALNE